MLLRISARKQEKISYVTEKCNDVNNDTITHGIHAYVFRGTKFRNRKVK